MADQKVRVGFFRVGDVRLELLEPSDPSSTIATFLDKKGEGLHHVAYTVDDIESRIAELKQGGVRMIDESPAPGRPSHADRLPPSQELVQHPHRAVRAGRRPRDSRGPEQPRSAGRRAAGHVRSSGLNRPERPLRMQFP